MRHYPIYNDKIIRDKRLKKEQTIQTILELVAIFIFFFSALILSGMTYPF